MVEQVDDSASPTDADARVDQTALQELILSTEGMSEFLDELVQLAAAGHGSCGITVCLDDKSRTVASSDALAARADGIQYAQGEGPCLEAMRTGAVVDAPDLATDDRWGNYRSYALAQRVRSVLSTPMGVDGQTFGALNLYSTEAGTFNDAVRTQAERWVQQASGAVGVALRLAERNPPRSAAGGGFVLPPDHRPGHRHSHGPAALLVRGGLRDPAQRLAGS